MGKRITLIGCGPGAPDLMTVRGQKALKEAEVIVGSTRLIDDFATDVNAETLIIKGDFEKVLDDVERLGRGKKVVFLVSGDPLFHSFGEIIVKRFGKDDCEIIPGIASFQYAFCRTGRSWKGYSLFSLHGDHSLDLGRIFEENRKFVLLMDPKHNLKYIKKKVISLPPGNYTFHVASNLSLPTENITRISFDDFENHPEESLSILIVRREDG